MKRLFYPPPIRILTMVIMLFIANNTSLFAEGSVDFRNYPGHRLFYNVEQNQQLKVYAAEGEFINVGSSHLNINEGTINVYDPNGNLVMTFNGADGRGIINNHTQEDNGPIGSINGGYDPGVVAVGPGQGGVWSIKLDFDNPSPETFVSDLLNDSDWDRATDQPSGPNDQRIALAWDVTVSQGNAGDTGGTLLQGRLYSNEFISILDRSGRSTSPTFYILTQAGYLYKVDFSQTDPWGFPIHSNSFGLVNSESVPTYMSANIGGNVISTDPNGDVVRSSNPDTWVEGKTYLYDPQAEDFGALINNKIFFNLPDDNLPTSATVTDLNNNNVHTTWLLNQVPTVEGDSRPFTFRGFLPANGHCAGELVAEEGAGGHFVFDSQLPGTAVLRIDVNGNNSYDDAEDITITESVGLGVDSVFWDGLNGTGTVVPANPTFNFEYDLNIRGGEMHLLMADIENNLGGVTMSRLNGPGSLDPNFYYDNSGIGGEVSGGGTVGNPLPTTIPFTYSGNSGDRIMLDQWAFFETNSFGEGTLTINIEADCSPGDHDNDGIPDIVDIDDDNDGVPDLLEFCHPTEGWACLPGGLDPSGDEDSDGIQNYQDADDAAVNSGCSDANNDGVCDQIIGAYDTDGDNVPDHFDLDSDNDGISDLVEAGHGQPDVDGNGVIDGDPSVFGNNGLYNPLETNDSQTGVANYVPWDWDGDGIPDHDDLDSDNDGILDVVEAGYASSDSNQDGRIDDGNGNIPTVDENGLVPLIDPDETGQPIPLPLDWDSDGVPDWHDLDADNDGILDVIEGGYQGNDTNGDGRIDDGAGNIPTVNSDGLPPVMDPAITGTVITLPPDTDNDGVRDWHDLDSDNDGINDTVENKNPDGDGDGFIGTGPITVDANGIATADANGPRPPFTPLVNTDGTGSADFRDLDADGDGFNDVIEGGLSDPDGDGIIGAGTPTVNNFGQATEGTTSNPPDTDNDGRPDFQQVDESCDNPEIPALAISATQVCEGSSVTLTASGVTGDGISYTWVTPSPGGGTNQTTTIEPTLTLNPVAVQNSGSYTVFATRDTCSSAGSNAVTLTVQAQPVAPTLSSSSTNVCGGGNITLTASPVGDPNLNYNWIINRADGSTAVVATTNGAEPSVTVAAESGTYSIEVSDPQRVCPNAVSNGVAISVQVPPVAPTLSSSAGSVCEGDNITLTTSPVGDAALSYNWVVTRPDGSTALVQNTNGAQESITVVAESGTYTIEVVDPQGICPNSVSNGVSVSVISTTSAPSISANTTNACEGDNITLIVNGPVDANLTYQWTLTRADGSSEVVGTTNNGQFVLNPITANQAGTYTLNVINNSSGNECVSEASNGETINVTPKPEAPVMTVDKDIHCEGDTLMFTSTTVAGDNVLYEFTFTNPDGRVDPLVTTSLPMANILGLVAANTGTYQVRAIVDGCPSDFSNDVPIDVASGGLPDVTATSSAPADNPVCEGENVTLSVTPVDGATYEWAGPNGIVGTSADVVLENATADMNGDYTVTITVNGCPKPVGPVTVQVDPRPATPTINVDNTTVCPGESFSFGIPPVTGDNITYEWYLDGNLINTTTDPSIAFANPMAEDSGSYTVIVKAGGCPSEPSEPVEVTVESPLDGAISTEPADGVCEGESITLTAPSAEGATYAWTGPNGFTSEDAAITLNEVTPADNGDYSVVVTVNGCPNDFGPTSIEINAKPAQPTISADSESICPGEGLILSTTEATGENITFDWLLNGTVLTTTDSPELIIIDFQEADAGDYTVVVKDGSCPSDPSEPVSVALKESLEGVTASSNSPVCIGDPINLTVTDVEGATFEWSGPNGYTSTEQNPTFDAATEADAGEYMVTVTIDGCPATIPPTTVEVTPKPEAPTVSISEGPVCEGTAATITIAEPIDGATYTVLDVEGNTIASGSGATVDVPTDGAAGMNTYTVISQVESGCPSEPSNPVDLEITAKPDEEAQVLTDPMGENCGVAPASVEATPPTQGTGTWTSSNPDVVFTDPNSPTSDVMGLEDGDEVIWTLANEACGEYSSTSISIDAMPPSVTANDDQVTVDNNETATTNVTGNDSPNNGIVTVISGPNNGTGTIDAGGNLTYTPNSTFVGSDQITYLLCDANCPDVCDEATVTITVEQSIIDCMVPDVISPNGDGLNDALVIPCSEGKTVGVKIFNRWGDLVFENPNYNNGNAWGGTWEGEDLPPGPYYYIFEENGQEPKTGCVSIAR